VSFGTSTGKQCVLARVRIDGVDGWGECVADDGFPGFSGEWNEGAWVLLRDVLGPALLAAGDVTSGDVEDRLRFVRGNPMAKATLIDAVLDAELRAAGRSLVSWLGADRRAVPCGVSIGIADSTDELRARVDEHLDQAISGSSSRSCRDRRRSRRRDPERPSGHLAVGRRQRGVPAGGPRHVPRARRARPVDDRTAAAP
jgi:hypothetical protein